MTPERARADPTQRSTDSTASPEAETNQDLRERAEALIREKAGEMPENLEVL